MATRPISPLHAALKLLGTIAEAGVAAAKTVAARADSELRKRAGRPRSTVVGANDATFGKVAHAGGRVALSMTDEEVDRLLEADAKAGLS